MTDGFYADTKGLKRAHGFIEKKVKKIKEELLKFEKAIIPSVENSKIKFEPNLYSRLLISHDEVDGEYFIFNCKSKEINLYIEYVCGNFGGIYISVFLPEKIYTKPLKEIVEYINQKIMVEVVDEIICSFVPDGEWNNIYETLEF
jgi:hypothetical protein